MHSKPEIRQNDEELKRTKVAKEYMLHGNIGSIINVYVTRRRSVLAQYIAELYDSTWQ